MKKTLIILGSSLVAVALIVYLGLAFFLGSAVTAGVNSFGPKLTKTKVELAGAIISPFSGIGTLKGLSVGNPAGWSSERAFYLGEIRIKIRPFSVLGDHIVIDEIFIDQPEFSYETKIVSSNIGELLRNIEEATGGPKKDEPATKDGKPIRIEIKKLTLQNGRVSVGAGGIAGAAMSLPMPTVAMENIGTKEGGLTPDQIALVVMQQVTGSVISATTKAATEIGSTMGAAGVDSVKKVGQGIKSLFGGGKQPNP